MNDTKNYKLHPPSNEQIAIIHGLSFNNVAVQAVAGSGKTTTSLHIARAFENKKILLLTYNKKLSLETKAKIKLLNLTNLDVYTFHAFAAKTWRINCQNDDGLIKIINDNLLPETIIAYNLIIIDEAQDITPIYYELLCKIITSNTVKVTLCVLGDKNQSIYKFNKADPRYLNLAHQVFNLNDLQWQYCQLSQSFRVNQPMVNFINDVFYQQPIMSSPIANDEKNDYIVTDSFNSPQLVKIISDLVNKYGKSNVFILAPSIKSEKTPVRKISNILSNNGILIYAPTNDDEKLDANEMDNKLCLSTFHQAKGLERKAVVVFGFDLSYFYYARDDDPLLPSNPLYVAISRALEKLVIVHHINSGPLPFINKDKIAITTNFQIIAEDWQKNKFNKLFHKPFAGIDDFDNPSVGVVNLLRYLPSSIAKFCKDKLEIITEKVTDKNSITKQKLFSIPSKLKLEKNGEQFQENVSTLTGIAALLNYEYISTNFSTPLTTLLNEITNNRYKTQKELPNLLRYHNFLENLIKKKEPWTINETLFLAALWNYFMDRYNFKLNQIPHEQYKWVKAEDFDKINSLIKSKISNNVEFEIAITTKDKPELLDKQLTGYIDCIDWDKQIVWEFKFVDKVTNEHYLQLAVYAYLIMTNPKYCKHKFKYFIYNIKKNQLFELKITLMNAVAIVKAIFDEKYGKKIQITDEDFIKNALEIMTKYHKK